MDQECKKCGHVYELREGCEPTAYCDECAHEQISQLTKERDELIHFKDLAEAERDKLGEESLRLKSETIDLRTRAETAEAKCASQIQIIDSAFDLTGFCKYNEFPSIGSSGFGEFLRLIDVLDTRLRAWKSDQCGQGLLEKLARYEKALSKIASADAECSRITINGVGYDVKVMASEPLERNTDVPSGLVLCSKCGWHHETSDKCVPNKSTL